MARDDMVALLQQRLVQLQQQEEEETHRLHLEEKVYPDLSNPCLAAIAHGLYLYTYTCTVLTGPARLQVLNPASAEEAIDARYSELADELAQLNFKKRQAGELNNNLLKSYMHQGPQCKALPAQFEYKESAAFDKTRAAQVHHFGGGGGGSHYHLAASKQFQKGLRLKGVVARHSKQAALRNGPAGLAGPPTAGKLSKKSRLRKKQSMARAEI